MGDDRGHDRHLRRPGARIRGGLRQVIRLGSLFTGILGLDLAVESVFGCSLSWACELDPYARAVIRQHRPRAEIYHDVTELENPPPAEIVCGGFPCQGFSRSGKRRGLDDVRSGLWSEFDRVIGAVGPDIVVIENVPELAVSGLGQVLRDLAARGLDAEWTTLAAGHAGAPHARPRLFILAYADCGRLQELGQPVARDLGGARGHESDRRHAFPPQRGSRRRVEPSPGVRRGDDGNVTRLDVSRRRSRLKALGNAVCPQQAEMALRMLIDQAMKD